jgi:IS30 family transposase
MVKVGWVSKPVDLYEVFFKGGFKGRKRKESEEILFEAVEDKFTMRFIKRLFKRLDFNFRKSLTSDRGFEDIQKMVRRSINESWDFK